MGIGKAVVFSILFATIAIPVFYARMKNKRRGLKKAVLAFYVYCTLWVFATAYVAHL